MNGLNNCVAPGTNNGGGAGAGEELVDIEEEYERILGTDPNLGRGFDPEYETARRLAEMAGAAARDLAAGDALRARGLRRKAARRVECGSVGRMVRCDRCRRRCWRPRRCRNRYCSQCGPREAQKVLRKYEELSEVYRRLQAERPGWILAQLDLTTRKLGRMPEGEDVRVFHACVKRFIRRVEKELGLGRGAVGVIYADEFGARNSNLHAHALYFGPRLPKPREGGRQGLLSIWWQQACEGTVFAGSFLVSVKRCFSFGRGLAHALKYPVKYVALASPERAADLERAFHGARRVHTLGCFYNALPAAENEGGEESEEDRCPDCGGRLVVEERHVPRTVARRRGIPEWEEVRRQAALRRALGGTLENAFGLYNKGSP